MNRKAHIIISLVKECKEKSNQELEKEIRIALSETPIKIPWMKKLEKVRVVD
jgi:hypothetical protein